MKRNSIFHFSLVMIFMVAACTSAPPPIKTATSQVVGGSSLVQLPDPRYEGMISVEQAILARRSVRDYLPEGLTLDEVAQILWAAQGFTNPDGLRTAPSAGALYPLEIYILVGDVQDLEAGIYHYQPQNHALIRVSSGDHRQALYEAALEQGAVRDAAAVIMITAIYERTTQKYGERGIRYTHIEVGCVTQNVYLQAEALDLGTVFIGAFHDKEIIRLLGIGPREQLLGLMPVGRK